MNSTTDLSRRRLLRLMGATPMLPLGAGGMAALLPGRLSPPRAPARRMLHRQSPAGAADPSAAAGKDVSARDPRVVVAAFLKLAQRRRATPLRPTRRPPARHAELNPGRVGSAPARAAVGEIPARRRLRVLE